MKYLIDTDGVIDHLKGEERVVKELEELVPEGVAGQLYQGRSEELG